MKFLIKSTLALLFALTTQATIAQTVNVDDMIKFVYYTIDPQFEAADEFSDGLAAVQKDGKWGYVDQEGTMTIRPQFEEAGSFAEGLAPVKLNGKWGFIDAKGTMIHKPKFDDASSFNEGLASVAIGETFGYINAKGEQVIDAQFEWASIFSEGKAAVRSRGKLKFIDKTGRFVIETNFDASMGFFEGMAFVLKNDKWGLINAKGTTVLAPQFDEVDMFSEGCAAVQKDNKWGYIDKSGKYIIAPKFDGAVGFKGGFAVVQADGAGYVIDPQGNYVENPAALEKLFANLTMTAQNDEGLFGFQRTVISMSQFLKDNIEERINQWQAKEEYETSTQWAARVTEASRNAEIAELRKTFEKDFFDYLTAQRIIAFAEADLQLKNYDADNQTYLLQSTTVGNIPILVPSSDARTFRENWEKIRPTAEPEFVPNGEDMILSTVTFTDGPRKYRYDSHKEAKYASNAVTYNFDAVTLAAGTTVASSSAPVNSDVNDNIPTTKSVNDKTFVLIIANEDYQKETPIRTAKNDAATTKEYCIKTLGIPEANIRYNVNCTWKNMESVVENFGYTMTVNPGAKFLVFYFGHGMADPDPKAEDSYLLPIDGSSVQIARDGYSRNKMLGEFAKGSPAQCMVFLESCFSGVTPTGEMLAYSKGTSGVRVEQKWSPIVGNIVVFSASSDAQTANAHPSQGHNIFTYELLKTLKESAGKLTLGELYERVATKTAQSANNLLNAKQTPTFQASFDITNAWKSWTLVK